MTVETEKFMTIRISGEKRHEFCETCARRAPMLTVTEAAQFAGINSRAIFRLIEAGEVHFRETATNLLLVCFDSLSAEKEKQQSIKEQKL
ncbi:MAG: hypothetical protein WBD22_01520 [Pyrinomonadaceae bacterium]